MWVDPIMAPPTVAVLFSGNTVNNWGVSLLQRTVGVESQRKEERKRRKGLQEGKPRPSSPQSLKLKEKGGRTPATIAGQRPKKEDLEQWGEGWGHTEFREHYREGLRD